MAQHDVAGMAVERDELADDKRVTVEVAVVPVVTEITCLEDVFEYATGIPGPTRTPVIHRHKILRHTEMIYGKGGK